MQITHNFREFATARRFVMMADSTTARTASTAGRILRMKSGRILRMKSNVICFRFLPILFLECFSQARAVIKPVCFVAVQLI